jgi:hypothetical protein
MAKIVEFHHGTLLDKYEKQANEQGFTFGDDAKWVQNIGDGLVMLYVQGCITDAEYNKILSRFQKKVLIKRLKRLEK